VGLAWIAKVDVNVDETRRDDEAACIDFERITFLCLTHGFDDAPVDDENITNFVSLIGWIDHSTALYPKFLAHIYSENRVVTYAGSCIWLF
jgi:hypothetical protein